MHNEIDHILISEETIAKKCAEIGAQLTKEYEGRFPLVIGVLKGAMPFMSDIVRQIDTHLEISWMCRVMVVAHVPLVKLRLSKT